MQGTSQSVPNHETLRKHPVVMSAVCANRKNLVTAAHQDYVFAVYLTKDHRSIREIANEKSIPKIALLSFFRFCHVSTKVSS
jgi:hypothetical protein